MEPRLSWLKYEKPRFI